MNTQQLLKWMEAPTAAGKDAGAELEVVVQQFPYFQTAHLLYIKSLHNENNFLYNNQLKVAAAYATNRKVLYDLITKKPDPVVVIEKKSEAVEISANEIVKEETTIPAEDKKEIKQPEFPKKRFATDPDEWESGMVRQLQLLHHWKTTPQDILDQRIAEINAEKAKTEEKKKEEQQPSAADEINTLLYVLVEPGGAEDLGEEGVKVNEEIAAEWEVKTVESNGDPEAATVNSETETETEVPEITGDLVQQEIIREAITSSIELEVDDTLPSLEELTGKKQEEKPAIQHDKKLSPAAEKQEESKAESTTEEISFGGWLNRLKDIKPEPEIVPETPQSKIIDKFIQTEPRIKGQKTTFYNPVNMARKSVQESDEFLTETLARIYAKQGNIPKAIRAYQKLSLKFPEKTAYFAALIEELKRTPNK